MLCVYRANMFENIFTDKMICNNDSIKSSGANAVVAISNLLSNELQRSGRGRLTY